jgi:multidrug efflux pump subunit AcrB
MKFFKQSLMRGTPLLFLGLFIALLGLKSFNAMPRSLFPEINYPRVVVEVNMGFTPLQVIEWSATSVLEKELRAVPGVRLVKSNSSRGLSSIDVFLRENEEVTLAVQRVNAKIAEARSLIPASAEITVRPITAAAFPAAEYCFSSKTKNSRELRSFVEYTVRPLIMVVPGIFDTKIIGGDLPELSVELDPQKLAARNLNVADINDRLKNSNSVDFLGPVDSPDAQKLAFGGKFVHSAHDIANIVVDSSLGQAVKISDVGQVQLINAFKTKHVSLSGTECVGLDVFYQSGIDQKITSNATAAAIADIAKKSPDINYRSWDLNDFTDSATNAVLLDLAVGMLIIALVTLLFLRNLRYSLIALLSMPLAAAFTFLAMSYLGLSINLMTLGGLTAAIGLVVDNTVIVLEMYHHRKSMNKGKTRFELLVETLSSVAKPMIFGTATIALVFTPIGYLSGVSGMFFAPMAAVHGSSLTISVLLALFLIPALILLFDKETTTTHEIEPEFENGKFAGFYQKLLTWSLQRSKKITALFLLIPLCGALLLPLAQTGFLPEWDEGDIVIDFRAESPIGLALTVDKIKTVENYLAQIPEIDFFIRKVGTGLGQYDGVAYSGEIVVKLKKDRKRSVFEIKDEISEKAPKLVEGFEFDLFQILPDRLNDLSGSAKPIVLYLHGEDDDKMDAAAQVYKTALSEIKGLDSVRVEEPEKSDELLFDLNESRSRALELNPTALNENVRFGLFSLDSSSVQIGPQSVPIRLRTMNQDKNTSLESVNIFTSKGGLKNITQLGKIETVKSKIESNHIDGSPVRTITAEISGRDLGSVVKDIQQVLKKNEGQGVYPELAGDYEMQQKSFKELMYAFLTGIILIFITSLFFSNRLSVALPLTICSLVPPVVGLVGCVVFQIPLDVSSFSGLISVTGIAVANSFMALSAIEALPAYNSHLSASVLTGMLSRLRPILMTNLAAMAGFIPIAIGLASGDEILRPFSIAIIVGLFGAIYTTLVLFPMFYRHYSRPLLHVTKTKFGGSDHESAHS